MRWEFKNYWNNTSPEIIICNWHSYFPFIRNNNMLAAKWAYSFSIFGFSLIVMSNEIKT